jgi:hypothetical protein
VLCYRKFTLLHKPELSTEQSDMQPSQECIIVCDLYGVTVWPSPIHLQDQPLSAPPPQPTDAPLIATMMVKQLQVGREVSLIG